MSTLVEGGNRAKYNISDIQLAAHASDFVYARSNQALTPGSLLTYISIAGSETTATTLATVTWYLLHNPRILEKLQHEVRDTFKSYGSINAQSAAGLPYLHAVCLEALRIYPPLPLGLPASCEVPSNQAYS